MTVRSCDVEFGVANAGGEVESAPPLSLCEWWWWCSDSVCDGCTIDATDEAAAGKSVVEASVEGCVLSVNEVLGLALKEAESPDKTGDAVSDGWTASVDVEAAIELDTGVLVMVGCRLRVAIELALGGEDWAWLVVTSGVAEDKAVFGDWPAWPLLGASVV
jgi:hypothetical protein